MMARLRRFLLISFVMVIGFMQPVWGDASSDAINKLNQRLQHLNTLQAQFDQKVVSHHGDVLQQSSGKVAIKRPNHFKWRIDKPMPQTIITDSHHLWIYQPDLKQVTQRRLQKRIGQIPLLLLTEKKVRLQNNFKVKQVSADVFQLIPKKQANFAKIRLQFVGNKPAKMRLVMGSGQTTRVQLRQVRLNQTVDADQFKFQAPSDVQVINMEKQS